MTVLVTGASGFLGSYVLEALRRRGRAVVAVGRRPPANLGKSRFISADLLAVSDWPALLREAGASELLHLAWYAEHGAYWTSPLNLRWVDATVRLVEAFCATGGQRVVVSGTCAEYDWSWGYCREDATPLVPATLYGTAKDAARRLVAAVCREHGVPCAWGRVFLLHGRGETADRLVPSLIAALRGQRPPFAMNAQAFRDVLHAADVADALLTLLEAEANGAFNICSGQPTALADVLRHLACCLEADPEPILALTTSRPDDPPLLVGAPTKMSDLGWRPSLTLEEGLARHIAEAGSY